MGCRAKSKGMSWRQTMNLVNKEYPRRSIKDRMKIAASIFKNAKEI
jgi:hypothetical protein